MLTRSSTGTGGLFGTIRPSDGLWGQGDDDDAAHGNDNGLQYSTNSSREKGQHVPSYFFAQACVSNPLASIAPEGIK